ncbi:hypothetical protein [Actinomadura fibrosa]|uniref:DivIVA domain-containing protein n=1 Tax=Actinomadura fibrosa TaxID=111802 RepID=A0ABW2XA49_9ACTN|nr:hypothetical protein [Actinomadura fibrosa]
MVVVLVLVGAAVLGAVVVLAMGRGGELAETHPDYPPLPLSDGHRVTGPDVDHLRLPHALWGYQVSVTDEALHRLAYTLTERDARIAQLEQQVDDLRRRLGEPVEPRHVGALYGVQEHGFGDPVVANGAPPPVPHLRKAGDTAGEHAGDDATDDLADDLADSLGGEPVDEPVGRREERP